MKIGEIRKRARLTLERNTFSSIWLTLIVISLICSVVSGIPFVSFILAGTISYALSRIYIKAVRGDKKVLFEDLLAGYNEDFTATIVLGIVRSIFIFLWSLLFIIPGIVKSYAYSMASFIQQDSDDKDWRSCLDRSQEMMKGYKGKLFLLDLSFIGWYILGFLCFGIGVLWVGVYHSMAKAHFYEELKAIKATPDSAGFTPSSSDDSSSASADEKADADVTLTPDAISAPAPRDEKND